MGALATTHITSMSSSPKQVIEPVSGHMQLSGHVIPKGLLPGLPEQGKHKRYIWQ